MPFINKVLVALGLVLAIGALGLFVYNQNEKFKKDLDIEKQIVLQKELLDKIVRSQSEYASKKDIEDFIAKSGMSVSAIKDDLSKLKATINAINVVTLSSTDQKATGVGSTGTGVKNPNPPSTTPPATGSCAGACINPDSFGYLSVQQTLSLSEKFGKTTLPIGSVGFSAWQEKPWDLDIKGREYIISSVVGKDEDERSYFYSKVRVVIDGKDYDLPITSAKTKEEYPEAKFSFWNPRLFMGIDGGISLPEASADYVPNISLALSSYGKYKKQPDFSIVQLGLGMSTINQNPKILITPVVYNVGNNIPLVQNLYVGPSFCFDNDGNIGAMIGLRVGL